MPGRWSLAKVGGDNTGAATFEYRPWGEAAVHVRLSLQRRPRCRRAPGALRTRRWLREAALASRVLGEQKMQPPEDFSTMRGCCGHFEVWRATSPSPRFAGSSARVGAAAAAPVRIQRAAIRFCAPERAAAIRASAPPSRFADAKHIYEEKVPVACPGAAAQVEDDPALCTKCLGRWTLLPGGRRGLLPWSPRRPCAPPGNMPRFADAMRCGCYRILQVTEAEWEACCSVPGQR